MRKNLFLLGVLFFMTGISAQAQFKFGLRVGANLSDASFSGEGVDNSAIETFTGFHIGPTIELMVPVINIGFDASILYSQQGFKIKEDFKTNTLDIPVNLKYKISALDILGIYFAVGPYASFKFSEDPDDLMESKSFGAGLNFGLGIDLLGSMQVGAGYKLGLTDDYGVAKDNPLAAISNFKGKQRGWTISAAYLF